MSLQMTPLRHDSARRSPEEDTISAVLEALQTKNAQVQSELQMASTLGMDADTREDILGALSQLEADCFLR